MTEIKDKRRLFLAVDPGPDNILQIREAMDNLRALAPRARWVRPEKLHVTLVFLGDVAEANLPLIFEAQRATVMEHSAFTLQFTGGDSFGEKNRPRVLWAGIKGDLGALRALQKTLAEKLEPIGYAPEHREYAPHLTLARAGDPRGDENFGRCAKEMAGLSFGETTIREIVLYESESTKDGARYVPLNRAELRP